MDIIGGLARSSRCWGCSLSCVPGCLLVAVEGTVMLAIVVIVGGMGGGSGVVTCCSWDVVHLLRVLMAAMLELGRGAFGLRLK